MLGFFYPIAIGFSMIGMEVYAVLIGKEPFNRRIVIGFVMGIFGIFIVSI